LPSFLLPPVAFMEEGIDSVDTGFRNCFNNPKTKGRRQTKKERKKMVN
jgi:hypothetical protein